MGPASTSPAPLSGKPEGLSNADYFFNWLSALLSQHFSQNRNADQIRVTSKGFFSFNSNVGKMRDHLRDLLIQLREETGEGTSDLYIEEKEAEIQTALNQKMAVPAVPIKNPSEIDDEQSFSFFFRRVGGFKKCERDDLLEEAVNLVGSLEKTYPWTSQCFKSFKIEYFARVKLLKEQVLAVLPLRRKPQDSARGGSSMTSSVLERISTKNEGNVREAIKRNRGASLSDSSSPPKKRTVEALSNGKIEILEKHLEEAKQNKERILNKRKEDFKNAEANKDKPLCNPSRSGPPFINCLLCSGSHFTNSCYIYQSYEERRKRCATLRLCTCCMHRQHAGRCRLSHACKACQRRTHKTPMCKWYMELDDSINKIKEELKAAEERK
ncbi:hypothetical protein QR680_018372 [Steinernema hermaphroditum]|uniref:Exportin-1 C-terminal domain-containing protein n=1 Tax=Steinernema hermaphroditum TaxID=289476 RepID=A0AA39HK34_9BILA|nr:hypothetical protein QR680_018372 [Steinernema hermaphroditum]